MYKAFNALTKHGEKHLKNKRMGLRIFLKLGAPTVLSENWGLILRTHLAAHNCLKHQSLGIGCPFLASAGTCIHAGKTPINIKINKNKTAEKSLNYQQ